MLIDHRCSIYEHRPRTCRTYDCRIFPAAGLEVEDDRPMIAQQARRWQFSFASEADRNQHAAVQAAASFIREHRRRWPTGSFPTNTVQLGVLAVRIHKFFLRRDEATGVIAVIAPDPNVVRAEVVRQTGVLPVSRRHRSRG